MKKLISLICAIAMIATMCALPVLAADDTIAFAVELGSEKVQVAGEVDVTVKVTGGLSISSVELYYDAEAFTYKDGSFAAGSTVVAVSLVSAADGVVAAEGLDFTGKNYNDEVYFKATFTALDLEAFNAIIGDATYLEKAFAVTIPVNEDINENLVYDMNSVAYATDKIVLEDATIQIVLEPTAPVVTGVEILKDEAALEAAPMIGDVLAVDYDYNDVNGDEEDGTAFQWYADGEAITDATDAEYTVTADDYDKVITVGVTPANAEEKGDEGVEVESEATAAVIANPDLKATIVEDSLTIEPADKIRVGRDVVVYYELNSPNGGADESTIIWTDADGNELVGEVSEDGTTFTPDKEDKDKYIKVTVIPDDDRTEANEEAAVELVAEVPVTKKSTGTTAWDDNAGSSLATPKTEDPVETDKPDETDKPVASGIEKFTDVDAEAYAWAVEGIDELVKAGIIVGVTDTTFEPETKTTRAHFVAMVMRAANAINEEAKASYADVTTDFWGYKEIASAEALGALAIFGENFEPEKVITREEMAYVLYGVATALEIELAATEDAEAFSDAASIVEEAADAVTALQKAGILHGMGDGTFMPKGETTRAQAAKVVHLLWTAAK